MIDEANFIQQQENEEQIKITDEIEFRLSHHELTQLLATIKNNIRACILELECAAQTKKPIVLSMNNLMGEAVLAGNLVHQMKSLILKSK